MSGDHQVLKTPITDATGNILNRRIRRHQGATGIVFPTTVAFPFFAVIVMAAKNMLALDAYSNHVRSPLKIFGMQILCPQWKLLLVFIIISAKKSLSLNLLETPFGNRDRDYGFFIEFLVQKTYAFYFLLTPCPMNRIGN